jgi:lipoprotein signal peptidase
VFNFADMAVVSGVCLLAYVLLFSTREDEQKLEAQG